jgi:hypothetical protein
LEKTVTIELFGQPHTFKANSEVTKEQEVADLLVKEVARSKKWPALKISNPINHQIFRN